MRPQLLLLLRQLLLLRLLLLLPLLLLPLLQEGAMLLARGWWRRGRLPLLALPPSSPCHCLCCCWRLGPRGVT